MTCAQINRFRNFCSGYPLWHHVKQFEVTYATTNGFKLHMQ
jgi:hypothetical protein